MTDYPTFIERHLTLWRIYHRRFKCLLGFHDWVNHDLQEDWCDSCPVDRYEGRTYAAEYY